MRPSGRSFSAWLYWLTDLVALLAVLCIYSYSKGTEQHLTNISYLAFYWTLAFAVSGSYQELYNKSRLTELGRTFIVLFLGTGLLLLIGRTALEPNSFAVYSKQNLIELGALLFTAVSICRLLLLNYLKKNHCLSVILNASQ